MPNRIAPVPFMFFPLCFPNRWYDAKVGRWASEDPLRFNGKDTNTYRYVGNSPVNATDPSGLITPDDIPNGVDNMVNYIRKLLQSPSGRTQMKEIYQMLHRLPDQKKFLEWKKAEKLAKARWSHFMGGGAVGCSLTPLFLYNDFLRVYNSLFGSGDTNWYESEEEIPPGTRYYNIWDGQEYLKIYDDVSVMVN